MAKLSEKQKQFLKLEKRRDEVKQYFDDLEAAVKDVAAEIGIGGMFQDSEGTVYKIVEPNGRYVHYEKHSYVRTRRPHEDRGDLSIKEAEAAGFKIPDKK